VSVVVLDVKELMLPRRLWGTSDGREEGLSMRSIPIGARGTFEAIVRRADLASTFKDASLPPVLSTPVMIKFMENAALRAIVPYLDVGETAVGTEISVRHLAATPVGRKVRAEAEVTAVDGTRVTFSVRNRL